MYQPLSRKRVVIIERGSAQGRVSFTFVEMGLHPLQSTAPGGSLRCCEGAETAGHGQSRGDQAANQDYTSLASSHLTLLTLLDCCAMRSFISRNSSDRVRDG